MSWCKKKREGERETKKLYAYIHMKVLIFKTPKQIYTARKHIILIKSRIQYAIRSEIMRVWVGCGWVGVDGAWG